MDILTACGVVVTVGGALGVIYKWLKPLLNMSTKFELLEKQIEDAKEKDKAQDEVLNMCVKGIYFLLRNIRTGNCLGEVEKVEEELHDYIFK